MTIFDAIDDADLAAVERLLTENISIVESRSTRFNRTPLEWVESNLTSFSKQLQKAEQKNPPNAKRIKSLKEDIQSFNDIKKVILLTVQRYEARLTSSESSLNHSTNSSPVAPAKPSLEDRMSGMLAKLKTTHDDKKAGSSLNQWFAAEQNLKDIEAAQVQETINNRFRQFQQQKEILEDINSDPSLAVTSTL